MSTEKYHIDTDVFYRLLEVTKSANLEQLADFLGINYGTLRNQKSRNSIPYDTIVSKLDGNDLLYVLKGYKIDALIDIENSSEYSNSKDDELNKLKNEVQNLRAQVELLKEILIKQKGEK